MGTSVSPCFEALTPNLLARTVETVEGGGRGLHSPTSQLNLSHFGQGVVSFSV